jgi:integrase
MNNTLHTILRMARISTTRDGSVFCTPQGTPCRNFHTAFERAVRKAGIVDFTFHDLRHTFASRLVMAGVDLPTVQALLGHKTIAMTLRYTHLSSDHKQRAVGKLEQFDDRVPAIFPTGQAIQANSRS